MTVAHLASLERAEVLAANLADRLEKQLDGREVRCGELGAVLGRTWVPGMLAICVAPLFGPVTPAPRTATGGCRRRVVHSRRLLGRARPTGRAAPNVPACAAPVDRPAPILSRADADAAPVGSRCWRPTSAPSTPIRGRRPGRPCGRLHAGRAVAACAAAGGRPVEPPRRQRSEPPVVPRPGRHAARRRRWAAPRVPVFRSWVRRSSPSLAVIVAVGVALTAWWVVRDQAAPVAPAASPPPASAEPLARRDDPAVRARPARRARSRST